MHISKEDKEDKKDRKTLKTNQTVISVNRTNSKNWRTLILIKQTHFCQYLTSNFVIFLLLFFNLILFDKTVKLKAECCLSNEATFCYIDQSKESWTLCIFNTFGPLSKILQTQRFFLLMVWFSEFPTFSWLCEKPFFSHSEPNYILDYLVFDPKFKRIEKVVEHYTQYVSYVNLTMKTTKMLHPCLIFQWNKTQKHRLECINEI